MNAAIFGAVAAISGLIVVGQALGLTWEHAPMVVLAVVLHLPALVPVNVQRRALGPALSSAAYPEIPMPFLVAIAWLMAGLLLGDVGAVLQLGAVFSVSIGVLYAAVRAIGHFAQGADKRGAHNPHFDGRELSQGPKRTVYQLRLATSLLSLCLLMATSAQIDLSPAWFAVPVVAALFACLIALASRFDLTELSKKAAISAASAVENRVAQNPPQAVVYYSSSKTAKHERLKTHVGELVEEGIPTAVIARELHSVSACRETAAHHVWVAPTIETLDVFDLPSVKAAIYVNDAIKNTHFIRFNDKAHILLATSGALSKLPKPTKNMGVYDAIVAPDRTVAARWRLNSEAGIAEKIIEFTENTMGPSFEVSRKSRSQDLALCLGPICAETISLEQLNAQLPGIRNWLTANVGRSLIVSVVGSETCQFSNSAFRLVKEASESVDSITIVKDAHQYALARADAAIVTSADEYWSLVKNGKPIIGIGCGYFPPSIPKLGFKASEIQNQLDLLFKTAKVQGEIHVPKQQFSGMQEAIDHFVKLKRAKGFLA